MLDTVHLDRFVSDQPLGVHTDIGENGKLLSGGQRQRLSIAKAIVQNKPILVLDESTSGLDQLTEHAILSNLFSLYKDGIIICISHNELIFPLFNKNLSLT